ncbi:bifunctional 5,10-methylenetetrahydrofolate dehydrogenase/5,10-methenyltetrahydrofolate cyclohydrolase [Micromonospora sp. Llam7]|uniref:tetrahydrofolate dehydrogenase/cyclohydrolase catalytic domain-containing protein n=1 Tax=Micromonospora tarapacensis TaxID=2835305 RepID=UPI001C82C12A|nr:tetrahydrofolate dehydrogenase/cyclohydrolase catalytic domain-containing protein [Micromonospora tarapacensis]MBX7266802.1 bifunctional 5,10-methylenetetrahydrofolate dehydrogenase/5,10-methenyltetrahydrofolate cyclohydrolase [Micromonospora tarapacensis]
MSAQPDNRISGREILRTVHELYASYREPMTARGRTAAIIRVEAGGHDPVDWQARANASRISAEQKVANFTRIGLHTEHLVLPARVTPAEFAATIRRANADPAVTAVIVQQPVPARLRQFVQDIAPQKDIDALTKASDQQVCATAEGIWRVVQPFTRDAPAVAVVGARGFVGRGVVTRLTEHGHKPLELDLGDNLSAVREADIVISVTGSPGLLGPQHIRPHHRLVVDSGFVPSPDGGVAGDISAEATGIPQNITPVPGGIGPVEMAVLVERSIRQELQPDLAPWQYAGRPYEARASGPAAAARAAASAFPVPTRVPRQTGSQTVHPPSRQRGGHDRGNDQDRQR